MPLTAGARAQTRRARVTAVTVVLAVAALVACGEKPGAAIEQPGHLFVDEPSGVGLVLPVSWAGRYHLSDSIAQPAAGLQRELSLHFVRADSSVVTEPPLLVVRVFGSAEWLAAGPAAARYGVVIARDAAHAVTVTTAPGNPLAQGSTDALAFDSLMYAVLSRPLQASLRPDTVSSPRGPGGPGSASP